MEAPLFKESPGALNVVTYIGKVTTYRFNHSNPSVARLSLPQRSSVSMSINSWRYTILNPLSSKHFITFCTFPLISAFTGANVIPSIPQTVVGLWIDDLSIKTTNKIRQTLTGRKKLLLNWKAMICNSRTNTGFYALINNCCTRNWIQPDS